MNWDRLADAVIAEPGLAGFWCPLHDVPSRPVQVVGDPVRFDDDLAAASRRAIAAMHYSSIERRQLPAPWCDWWPTAAQWAPSEH